jgi:hypothetical protein
MKQRFCRGLLAALLLGTALPAARAFPPAPSATIYGLARDQYGTPLSSGYIVLQSPNGSQVSATIQSGLAVGINYAVQAPMDAGTTATLYAANALVPKTPYTLYVVTGSSTNLPIEMSKGQPSVGLPASQTRQNLTLGVDSNGDGIPDAWETEFMSELGTNVPLSEINVNADYAGDGRTLLQEYLLGNFPFNPGYNFGVRIVSQSGGAAVIAFTTMTGRAYQAYGSADLQNWTPLSFTIPAVNNTVLTSYTASSVQPVEIQTIPATNAPPALFFRLSLQ